MWPYLLAGGATLLDMEAGRKAGAAEERAGAEDLTSALVAGSFRDRRISEKRDRVLSSMRARAGASGVEMVGSPLEVLMHAAGQAERDLVASRYATEADVAAARERIRAGGAKKSAAVMGGLLRVGGLGMGFAKEAGIGYKPAGDPARFTDEDLMTYGWD